MAGVRARRLRRPDADVDRDFVGAQAGMALTGNVGVWILNRGDDAGDAGGDDGVGAWRGPAVMRARLEGHVKRRALGRGAGAIDRLGFGMRSATRLGPAAADNDAPARLVSHQNRTDGGIGPRVAKPTATERQRQRHEAPIFRALISQAQIPARVRLSDRWVVACHRVRDTRLIATGFTFRIR